MLSVALCYQGSVSAVVPEGVLWCTQVPVRSTDLWRSNDTRSFAPQRQSHLRRDESGRPRRISGRQL